MSDVIFYSAQEAYDIAMENFDKQLERNREELRDLIMDAARKGQFSVVYDRQQHPIIRSWLITYGYEVTEKTIGDRVIWIVSWENARSL